MIKQLSKILLFAGCSIMMSEAQAAAKCPDPSGAVCQCSNAAQYGFDKKTSMYTSKCTLTRDYTPKSETQKKKGKENYAKGTEVGKYTDKNSATAQKACESQCRGR